MVLDIIGGKNSQFLHGFKVLLGMVSPQLKKKVTVPIAGAFILDLNPVEEPGGSSLVDSVVFATGAPKRSQKCSFPSKDDDA